MKECGIKIMDFMQVSNSGLATYGNGSIMSGRNDLKAIVYAKRRSRLLKRKMMCIMMNVVLFIVCIGMMWLGGQVEHNFETDVMERLITAFIQTSFLYAVMYCLRLWVMNWRRNA